MIPTDRDPSSALVFAAEQVADQLRADNINMLYEPGDGYTKIEAGSVTSATGSGMPGPVRQGFLEHGGATLIGVVPPHQDLYSMVAMADMADEDLMAAVTTGSPEALEQLYERHARICFGLALKIVSDPSVAEDITQDVFIKVWSRPDLFLVQRGKFMSWLLTIVHHRSIDKLRTMRAGDPASTLPIYAANNIKDFTSIEDIPDVSPSLYESAWTHETSRLVLDALNRLPKQQHEVLVLAYFEGLTQKEIAAKLNKPLGTVKTHTRSALHALHALFVANGLLSVK